MTAITATDRTGLAQVLRALKLSGMLATLDARLAQASAGDLGHLDFLQVLCEDEISRRASVSLAKRLRRARFEEQATLEGFDFAASPKLPAAQIRDLAALRWLHAGESVILHGPVGVGKTHVAQARPQPVPAGHGNGDNTIIQALTSQISHLKKQHRNETQALRAALEQAHGENLQLRRELTRLGWNGQLASTLLRHINRNIDMTCKNEAFTSRNRG